MPITTLPAVPTIDDPQNFATEADALLGALPTFVTEANTLATQVQNNATTASTAATSATTAASTASAAVTTAANSATSAAGSASSASTSATNAAASAITATTQATNAATSATNANTSAASASAIVTSSASSRPSIRPSLLLDFSNTKVLDPRITFARNSIGTYFGNLQHKCEENVLTYSEQFDNAIWGKAAVSITANSVTAPNATTTAETMTADGTSSVHGLNCATGSTAGTTRTFSIYASAGTNSFIQLMFNTDVQAYANFNIATGVVGTVGSSATATITSVGNTWYRCSITTSSATAASNVYVNIVTSNTAARYESNTLNTSVYIWGAQLEYRNFAGAYIGTTASSVSTYMTTLLQANANIPRFDYDPITGESKGFFVEETRTNLLTYSSDLSNAAWSKQASATILTNAIVSPDGTLNACRVQADQGLGTYQSVMVSNGATVTISYFVKAGTATLLMLRDDLGAGRHIIFSTSTWTITGTSGTIAGSGIIPIGNGWYRVYMTYVTDTTSSRGILRPDSVGSAQTFYQWGCQIEVGAFPTSYIPTTSATVTRASEVAYISGTNFSTWYRQDAGSMYCEYNTPYNGSIYYPSAWYFQNSDFTNRFGHAIPNGNKNCDFDLVTPAGTHVFIAHTNALDNVKHAVAFKVNDVASTANGGAVNTTASTPFPVVDRVYIGGRAGGAQLNGCIKRIAYYPKRLTNTELQTLST